MTNGTLALALPSGRSRGYAEVGAAALVNGAIGVMVSYSHMPTGMLLTLRMVVATAILAVPFLLFRRWREVWQHGVPLRLLALGLVVAVNLILYFVSIRYAGVAIAIFLSYMAPLYLAVIAPIFLKERTEHIVWVALGISVVGMLAIVLPGAFAGGTRFSVLGVTAGVGAGFGYAGCLLMRKKLRPKVTSATIVLSESTCTALAVLPLGLWQISSEHYVFSGTDVLMAVLLGSLTTALSFTLFVHGMRYIKVQHSSIIGYLEPVSAPLYALLFLGQRPSPWTLLGGALIIAAGVLLVVFGKAEEELYG
jgi:drug/metabolite transporter (DMT)-like permease